MSTREVPFETGPAFEGRAREFVSALLRTASRALDSLARRVALDRPAPASEPQIEFHGDAGAPEGALYVNGQLVGHLLGVDRL